MVCDRIYKLRSLFQKYSIFGYVVPSTDEYLNEYTPDRNKRLQYISNFSGSNGVAIITINHNLFFTDGRYLDQAKNELYDSFEIFDIKNLPNFDFLQFIDSDTSVGYDPSMFTTKTIKLFDKLNLSPISAGNLIDIIWNERPKNLGSLVHIHDEKFAGKSHIEKIDLCRAAIAKHEAKYLIITSPESISWLLNLRAADIDHVPLVLSNLIMSQDQLYLFIDHEKITNAIFAARAEITIKPPEEFTNMLNDLTDKILYDEKQTALFVLNLIKDKNILSIQDPCILPKACKNEIEIKHAIGFHIQDAVALCEFLSYIDLCENLSELTEYDLGETLTKFRAKQNGYIMDSFTTICGFKENSAIVHYKAKKHSAKQISGDGILLVDSGGQYQGATTDVTRTIAIGEPTEVQKLRYTQVLKGHIALASAKFPCGTTGANLDILARQFLWQDYKDYPHGTGHGVGSFLNVHEGPQSINKVNNISLQPGMILSNEPGYYEFEQFGIRIENLIYLKECDSESGFLEFVNLTLVPFDLKLINYNMLTKNEISYIKNYYADIKTNIFHLLSTEAGAWLKKICHVVC